METLKNKICLKCTWPETWIIVLFLNNIHFLQILRKSLRNCAPPTVQKSRKKMCFSALARLSNFLNLSQSKILMETFIKPQFSYCPLTSIICEFIPPPPPQPPGCWIERRFVVLLSDFSAVFSSRNLKGFFFSLKLVDMAHHKASVMKLTQEQLPRITFDYQGKFNGGFEESYLWLKRNNLFGLESNFSKLEVDIQT